MVGENIRNNSAKKIFNFRIKEIRPGFCNQKLEEKAFLNWHQTWVDSYKFFKWEPTIYSDQWSRQDSILLLMHEDEYVGSTFFKTYPVSSVITKYDSYFRMWPETTLKNIKKTANSNVLVCSWFTLHKKWRKGAIDLKYILAAVSVKKFMESPLRIMLGTMVVRSNMNTLTYELGAKCLVENINEKNLGVDLVWWDKDALVNFKFSKYNEEIESMWYSADDNREAA